MVAKEKKQSHIELNPRYNQPKKFQFNTKWIRYFFLHEFLIYKIYSTYKNSITTKTVGLVWNKKRIQSLMLKPFIQFTAQYQKSIMNNKNPTIWQGFIFMVLRCCK